MQQFTQMIKMIMRDKHNINNSLVVLDAARYSSQPLRPYIVID
jgi:hypothetical protein